MTAVQKPLYIEQGASFALPFTWHSAGAEVDGKPTPGPPKDLTGWTARMQIRKSLKTPALITATTENDRIVLGGTTGTVAINLSAEDTMLLTITSGVYDLELVRPDGFVHRLMESTVEVKPNVTRDDP